jgi:8-oxo-dGTP pyrophosphatase MutT (NUDIX family)
MSQDRWKPAVTVAAVIAEGGRYLLVQEHTREGLRLNNPAGHLDPGESPQEAVQRECLEETARAFTPEALVGLYFWRFTRAGRQGPPEALPPLLEGEGHLGSGPSLSLIEDVTYLRIAYCGRVGGEVPGLRYDEGIERTLWLTPDEIRARRAEHRSPLVMRCIDDHLAGRRFPLDLVHGDPTLQRPFPLG